MAVKVLLVDDDEAVLASLGAVLASRGYEVICAKNGHEALERFRENRADLALLDLNMPIKGGWDAFEQLTAYNPLMPVIVITARPDQYPLAAAAGVAALMEKPLDIPLLLATIRELLAEPPEARLSRITGKGPMTRYLETHQPFVTASGSYQHYATADRLGREDLPEYRGKKLEEIEADLAVDSEKDQLALRLDETPGTSGVA